MEIPALRPRRVWVDSGPSGSADPGERIIALIAEGWWYEAPPTRVMVSTARTTASMGTVMHLDLPPPPSGAKSYMDGNEGSDLVGVYYALDRAEEVQEGQPVEILGDGQVFDYLAGRGRVSARYAGRDWAPDMLRKIRAAETRFPRVVYRTIASSQNRAGHFVDELKRRSRPLDGSIRILVEPEPEELDKARARDPSLP